MNRRGFLLGLGAVLAAPAVISITGRLLVPAARVLFPDEFEMPPVTGLALRNGVWVPGGLTGPLFPVTSHGMGPEAALAAARREAETQMEAARFIRSKLGGRIV